MFVAVSDYVAAVTRYAASYAWRNRIWGGEREDVIQDALEGLMIAADRYRPGAVPFSGYMWSRVHGAIVDGIRTRSGARGVAHDIFPLTNISLSKPIADSDTIADTIVDPTDPYQFMFDRCTQQQALALLLLMPARTQAIVKMHYIDEISLKAIGALYGVSESRVCQIAKAAIRKLRQQLA